MIIACSHGLHLAKQIAKQTKQSYSELNIRKFPDGELYVKFQTEVKGKNLVFIQSFYDNISDCVVEVLFAAHTARELGAKKLTLVAPYFPYLRQDKRFHKGETISIGVMGKLVNKHFDKVMIVDPHLHRKHSMKEIFSIGVKKLTSNNAIAEFIQKKYSKKNTAIVGPDSESYQWAQSIGDHIGFESTVMNKKRWSSTKVKIYFGKEFDPKGKKIVIVDDIISSGHTLLETIKALKKMNIKEITCICVHGLFAQNALTKLRKTGAKIYCTNSIPNKASRIDISEVISQAL